MHTETNITCWTQRTRLIYNDKITIFNNYLKKKLGNLYVQDDMNGMFKTLTIFSNIFEASFPAKYKIIEAH